MEDKITRGKLHDLIQDDRNLNKGTERGQQLIEKSLREFGAGRSILLDKNNRIIAGNKTHKNAELAGLDDVIIVETAGTKLVAVKRTDVDLDTKKGREMALADNATVKVDLQWDTEELNAVADDFGIDTDEWDVELDEMPVEPTETTEDDFDEEQDEIKTVAQRGDVFVLGEHRLMCGDSTAADAVAKLMNGERADLSLTDPPYGVDIVQHNHVGGGKLAKVTDYAPILGDETPDPARKSYDIMKDVSDNQIIFGGNYFTDFLPPKACWCIWDKENTGNFADVEMAWTSFDKGAKLYRWLWNGLCRKGERAVEGKSRVHPTQKPVGLIAEILKDFTKEDDIVLDCFGGSGSTLIACEQIDRTCYMIEYEAHYVDVIIKRWETLTGEKAVLLDE